MHIAATHAPLFDPVASEHGRLAQDKSAGVGLGLDETEERVVRAGLFFSIRRSPQMCGIGLAFGRVWWL